jgi:hypothetical protein
MYNNFIKPYGPGFIFLITMIAAHSFLQQCLVIGTYVVVTYIVYLKESNKIPEIDEYQQ